MFDWVLNLFLYIDCNLNRWKKEITKTKGLNFPIEVILSLTQPRPYILTNTEPKKRQVVLRRLLFINVTKQNLCNYLLPLTNRNHCSGLAFFVLTKIGISKRTSNSHNAANYNAAIFRLRWYNLELRQGLEAPYRVILILWIKSKQRSNIGYTPRPRRRLKVIVMMNFVKYKVARYINRELSSP